MPLKIKAAKTAILAICAAALAAYAQFLYPSPLPKVETPWPDTPYDSVLIRTWHGIRTTLVDAYPTGMVHRPKSNRPGDAVSEGISYGMFLALYMNDQRYFNSIWEAGVSRMWVGGEGNNYYDWRRDPQGNQYPSPGDNGPASDADQDIALLLIFADQLVKKGLWQPYTGNVSGGYEGHARLLLQSIRTTMIQGGRYLLPGRWGNSGQWGPDVKNPGYVAPAFYRVFGEFEPEHKSAWDALIDGSYEMIEKSPGYARGLIQDWCTIDGGTPTTEDLGYNPYHEGKAFYRDAIRIHWRLATDYLWYGEPRAKAFLDNAMRFLEGKGGPPAANFFTMAGESLPANDVEVLGEGVLDILRSRREHSHLTLGMWAAAAMGSGGPELARSYSDALLGFYEPGTNYFGRAVDPTGGRLIENAVDVAGVNHGSLTVPEDTLRNEMYFDQFLAWFGASILGGAFTNVWDDLKDGVPQGPPTWRTPPAINTHDIDASVEPMRLSAVLSHPARWTVEIRHDSTGQTVTFSGRSDSISAVWYGMTDLGAYMPQGFYGVTVNASGLVYTNRVWLGRPFSNRPNLISGNRLLVDDFADGDVYPYIGRQWTVHTDADHDGGNSQATISFGGGDRLTWSYTLNKPHWQFATLDWTTEPTDFRNGVVDTLVISASSQKAGLEVSLQLLSADFNIPHEYHFYEYANGLTLGLTPQTFRIPLNADNFRQRLDGSGKEFATTLAQMTGIRFHVQYDEGSDVTHHSGAIILHSVHFAGRNVSTLYSYEPPPDYLPPPDGPISVRYRADRNAYSIRRSANMVRISLPHSMVDANAVMVDVRGRTVRRMTVSTEGRLDIATRGLAAGVYFVDIRKPGTAALKLPLRFTR